MNFYQKQFTESEVEALKKETENKNAIHKYNNLGKDYGTRWVGTAGELTFKEYLDRTGSSYTHYYDAIEKDTIDFKLGKINIDVKTLARKHSPRLDWSCDVDATQMEKTIKQKIVNVFVFASYNTRTNVCSVLGSITVDSFLLESDIIRKGEMLPNNNPTPASNDLYHMPISYLKQLKYVDDFLVDNWLVV